MIDLKNPKRIVPLDDIEIKAQMEQRQWDYIKIADKKIKEWSTSQNAVIFRTEYVPIAGLLFDYQLSVFIFYRKDFDLNRFIENNIVEETKKQFIAILTEIGYVAEFNSHVSFEFDSDENVQRYCKGNYGIRIT